MVTDVGLAGGPRGGAHVYVSVGASGVAGVPRREFLLMAPASWRGHVETLAMVAHFHSSPAHVLDAGSVVEIGRSWVPGSAADCLSVSLPYAQGPAFEWMSARR